MNAILLDWIRFRFFSEEELKSLHALSFEYPLSELRGRSRILEERSIDYAYVSSKIEGSTYSKAGVSTLLKYGWTEGGKPLSDALMLVDLNATFTYLMTNAKDMDVCTQDCVKDIHAKTTEHQLKSDEKGRVRQNAVAITGSSYRPLDSPVQLNSEFDRLIKVLRDIRDPFEQAAYIHCNLAYLLYFAAGNKRTSRLMQTAILVHNGITPLFLRAGEIQNYLKAVISYYEFGDRRSYADLFVRNYRYTIDYLLGRTAEQLEAVADDERRLQEAWAKRRKY